MENKTDYLKRETKSCHYDRRLILEVVKLVEEGMPRKVAKKQFDLGASTLDSWMRDYGSKSYQEGKRKKIPPLERRKITCEVAQRLITVKEAQKKYNIKSVRTINNWLYQWRRENRNFSSPTEPEMAKKKQKGHPADANGKSLQKALEDAQLRIEALNTMIDVAEERLKIDIRKKSGTKQ